MQTSQSEDFVREVAAMLVAAPHVLLTVDRSHAICYQNRAAPPRTAADVVGRSVYCFLHPGSHERVRAALTGLFEGGPPVELEAQIVRADGGLSDYRSRMSPILRDGVVDRVVITATDITEHRRTELELSRSRSFSARLQKAQEAERLRVARELHDGLGQLLTALRTDLGWLEERLPDDSDLSGKTRAMSALVVQTIQTVREIATQLRPSILDDLGLSAALHWLAQETCGRARIACELDCELGDAVLGPDRALCLFRICQEALTNVARHAAASRVCVFLRLEAGQVCLLVEDDGVGIPARSLRNPESIGIQGMEERARLWGGTAVVASRAQGGTRVAATIPLDGPADQ